MRDLTQMRADLTETLYRNTSSRSADGTRKLLAHVIHEPELSHDLMNCTARKPCNLVSCPTCSRTRGKRYFTQSLKPAISELIPRDDLYWITINTNTTTQLDDTQFRITEHRSLKTIVDDLNCHPIRPADDLRIWGCREVEPLIQPDASFHWKWHWHLIVHMGDVNLDVFTQRLRARWNSPHAVRVDAVRADTERQLHRSLLKLASYPVKSRFTYLNPARANERTWLPPEVMTRLVLFNESRGVKWNRFVFGRMRSSS
jgi:hypothetical protein